MLRKIKRLALKKYCALRGISYDALIVSRKLDHATKIIRKESADSENAVFVDCGFNRCYVLEQYINRLPRFTFYGFEVNEAQFLKNAQEISKKYDNVAELQFAAVNDRNGTVEMYLGGMPDTECKAYNEGTSILTGKRHLSYGEPRLVKSIDFSEWLSKLKSDCIVIKMDVEGAEYPILEHLIATDEIRKISVLIVEWHANQFIDINERLSYQKRQMVIESELSKRAIKVIRWI